MTDPTQLAAVGLSIIFLGALVYLLYKKASEPQWAQFSKEARKARKG